MTPSEQPDVELYVRSLASRTGRTERVIDHLCRLDRRDEVASVTVTVWGDRVGLSTAAGDTALGQSILDSVSGIREWADDNAVSVDPFFQDRTTHSAITDETYRTLQLPSAMLTERRDGTLTHVTPHEADEMVWTIEDRLEVLTTDAEATPEKHQARP